MHRKVKVAIVGAGSGGLTAAGEIKKVTDDFVIINSGPYGTTCARVGCMPSKVLIHAANDFHRRKVFSQVGIHGGENLTVRIPEVMAHVRSLRDRFVRGVMQGTSSDPERNIEGHAEFLEPNVLRVGDQHIEADAVVLATGSTPVVPGPWKEFGSKLVTTDDFFELEDLPERVAVIGLGVIGVELGQAMARLGVKVTGVGRNELVGGVTDPEVNAAAIKYLGSDMDLWLGESAQVKPHGDSISIAAGEKSAEVDLVLACLGRRPNVTGIGLEKIGVSLNGAGIPEYNPNTMQVGKFPIFIAGDVTGDRSLLHEAADEGRIAGYNALHSEPQSFRRRASLGICFSDPNIASAGKRYADIQDSDHVVGEVSFEGQGRALSMVKNKGHLRVYAETGTGRLLGAEMIAPLGEHLAHLLAWEIQNGATVLDVLQKPFYHPVVEEGLRTALRDCVRKVRSNYSPFELAGCWGDCMDSLN